MNTQTIINCPVIVLVGPTAIGKTALSFELIKHFDCEIISMDSMQVYRYMDIGTAKPGADELSIVKHHLINIVNPDEQYDASRFVKDCLKAIKKIESRGHAVLLTGGTGLYLQALTHGLFSGPPADKKIRTELLERLEKEGREVLYSELCRIDPETGKRVHKNDTQRLLRGLEIFYHTGVTWSEFLHKQKTKSKQVIFTKIKQVIINCSRERLYRRIGQRSEIMLQQGLVDEVKKLHAMGYGPQLESMQSIGYRHANLFLAGKWDMETMKENLVRDTRKYAKRQLTWFKRNKDLNWFERNDTDNIIQTITNSLF